VDERYVFVCVWCACVCVREQGRICWLFAKLVLTDNYLVIVIRLLIAAHLAAVLGAILDHRLDGLLLAIHGAATVARLLPRVVILDQTGN